MEKHTRLADVSGRRAPGDAFFAAESVKRDFTELVALFDWRLDTLEGEDRPARTLILSARAAAQRGLKLTSELVESIRTRN